MHSEAYEFVRAVVAARALTSSFRKVVEIGARNINGSIRPLFAHADLYVGTDIKAGKGVDMVADATDASAMPASSFDTVVCCEVLEHAPVAPIVASAAAWLEPGGFLIATMATTGRVPHSAVDGGALRPGEHYENVTAEAMHAALDAAGLTPIIVMTNERAGDLYVVAQKPEATHADEGRYERGC